MKDIYCCGLALSSEPQKRKFHVVVWQTTSKIATKACRTCSTIIFPHSSNEIIDLWRCRGRCSRHFLNSLFFEVHVVCQTKTRNFQMTILRTFALIVTAHPYCAGKFECHVMHGARALGTKTNNQVAMIITVINAI